MRTVWLLRHGQEAAHRPPPLGGHLAYQRYFGEEFVEETEPGMTLLVCHGNVIRYLICRVLGLPGEAFARFDLFNCGLCRVDWKTVLGCQLTGFNDAGHLPLEMQSYI